MPPTLFKALNITSFENILISYTIESAWGHSNPLLENYVNDVNGDSCRKGSRGRGRVFLE